MQSITGDWAPITDTDRGMIERAHGNGLPVYLTYKAAPVIGKSGCVLHYRATRTKLIRSRKEEGRAARGKG